MAVERKQQKQQQRRPQQQHSMLVFNREKPRIAIG